METRAAVRRAEDQRRAAEEFTQEWLRRQGPGAAIALERIQNATQNGEHGDMIIDPGPVARATAATFAVSTGKRPSSPGVPFSPCRLTIATSVSSDSESSEIVEPDPKSRRVNTRARARRAKYIVGGAVFETAIQPVVGSGFLHWYDFLSLGGVNRSSRALWLRQRESYGPWKDVLTELNKINCTNKCSRCEQAVTLKVNRSCCDKRQWEEECAKRTPDFVGVVDILMSSGVLTWRQRGGIRRICKATYSVHKEQCTCRNSMVDRSSNMPFLKVDPRFQLDWDLYSNWEKCDALIRYTQYLVRNLRSFYNFQKLTDNETLPYGLAAWDWTDIQAINLQTQCPKRYAFVMNVVSLFMAQGELHRCPPKWYRSAFLGDGHNPYEAAFADSLSSELTESCLPPTDENLVKFLRNRCYPSKRQQEVLGPLVNSLFVFAPLFKAIPLHDRRGPAKLPRSLENLDAQLIESMSQQMICSIM